MFDVTNPEAPKRTATLRTTHYAKNVFLSGDRLFAVSGDSSDWMNPVGALDVFDTAALP